MASKLDKGFNLNVFANASHKLNRAEIDKIMVPYSGTVLLKRPIWLKRGSSKAVNPKIAKVKFVFLCPTNR